MLLTLPPRISQNFGFFPTKKMFFFIPPLICWWWWVGGILKASLCATICAINSYVQCAIVQRKAKSSRPLSVHFPFHPVCWAAPAYQMIAPAAAEKVQEICEWYLRRRNSPKLHQIEIVAPPILKWHTIEKISLSSFSEMAFNWNVNTTPTSWNGIELKWYIQDLIKFDISQFQNVAPPYCKSWWGNKI